MIFAKKFVTFTISNFYTTYIRYLEHSLSRTFAISNFFAGPLRVRDNERRLYIVQKLYIIKIYQPKSNKRIDYNQLYIPEIKTNFRQSVAEEVKCDATKIP